MNPSNGELLAQWNVLFPDVPPVGFLLREAYPARWLRIYSLPGGKRYPTSGFDYAELLRRHNTVADDVLGTGTPCAIFLLHTCKGRGIRAVGRGAGLTASGLPRVGQLSSALADEEAGVFAAPMCLFGTSAVWARGGFNQLMTEIAEDRSHGLVVSLESGGVYAPYDGGADLIYRTEGERDRAHEHFAKWRSPREDGL